MPSSPIGAMHDVGGAMILVLSIAFFSATDSSRAMRLGWRASLIFGGLADRLGDLRADA